MKRKGRINPKRITTAAVLGLAVVAVLLSLGMTSFRFMGYITEDSFAVLMPKESPLAEKKAIRFSDLKDYPVIVSRASEPFFSGSKAFSSLNIVATYNLIYNASLLVEDGLGYAICFDRLINTTGDSRLCIRPLVPRIENAGNLIWKKYQVFSPAVRLFIEGIRKLTES